MVYISQISRTWGPIIISLVFTSLLLLAMCAKQDSIPVTEGKILVNGIHIYYKTMGSGTPTFVLHGGPGDTHDTLLQLKPLADQYKLIFYDQRAAGRSTGDEDIESHTVETFVEDLEQLRLKLAPDKINIIGGSWGAMLGLQYTMKYPDHVNKLVLMSSMGIRSEYLKHYQANIEKRRSREDSLRLEQIVKTEAFEKRLPETVEEFWRIYFKAYCYNPDFADSIHLWMRDTTYAVIPGRHAKLWEFFMNYDIQDDLNKITCPTLILHGDADPTPLEWVKPIHENINGSQLVIIENAGHWLWVEAPERVITLIRNFLK